MKKAVPVNTFQKKSGNNFPSRRMEGGGVRRSEALYKPSSVKACVLSFTRRKRQKAYAEKCLAIMKELYDWPFLFDKSAIIPSAEPIS